MRPAEGVFLFHPRAIERLRGRADGDQLRRATAPYYELMARGLFLARLETENLEALSVIEGLPLPDWTLLLPMPSAAVLRSSSERALLRDYWGRRFEGEVARGWQMARDDNRDLDAFGPAVLTRLIGAGAVREAQSVLVHSGVPGAADGPAPLCRAFVARVVRLRYFAPGIRGYYFPAVADWAVVDRWLEDSGLDLPAPLAGSRLPLPLERCRPSMACGSPSTILALPGELPFVGDDPDQRVLARVVSAPPLAKPADMPAAARRVSAERTPPDRASSAGTEPCLEAIRDGASIRRSQGCVARARSGLRGIERILIGALLAVQARASRLFGRRPAQAPAWIGRAAFEQLRLLSSAAQRAELDGRFAAALRFLREAGQACYRMLGGGPAGDRVNAEFDRRQRSTAESFADLLAVTWHLSHALTGGLNELIQRLVAQQGAAAGPAQAILGHLETVLLEGRTTYYRLSPGAWLRHGRLREVLPFEGTLKSLGALQDARRLVDELPWTLADQERLGAPLESLAERAGKRLEQTLAPRIERLLNQAGLTSDGVQGRLTAGRLTDALSALVRRRGHLKFGDVRDLINRDIVSLPDWRPADLHRADRLGRFDRLAYRELPGIYQRGEPYVKGLQILVAPLFGTGVGRGVLRWVLLPALAAWTVLHVAALLGGLAYPQGQLTGLTDGLPVLGLAALLSLLANSAGGRTAARLSWQALVAATRWLLVTAPLVVLHWPPVARLIQTPLVQILLKRLLAAVAIGLVPLLPVAAVWLFAFPQAIGAAAWVALLATALAVGTLVRETPEGRRRLDDLGNGWQRIRQLLRHEGLAALIAPVMSFFSGLVRSLAAFLYRVRTRLSPRLDEPVGTTVGKTLLAVPWAVFEALLRFYTVVLIEPQLNPVKHFPAVTLGHKLMLPLLPSLATGMHNGLAPLLPEFVSLPLITLTIALLPGLFGFLFWELKEDWTLYTANRPAAVPQARIGAHAETFRTLLRRGFHSGTIPKSFDRLQQSLDRQIRDEIPQPKQVRVVFAELMAAKRSIAEFVERELLAPLRLACPRAVIVADQPRISTLGVELRVRVADESGRSKHQAALWIEVQGRDIAVSLEAMPGAGPVAPECRQPIGEHLRRFAERCGASAARFGVSGAIDGGRP